MSKVWKTLWSEIPVAHYPESSSNALLLSSLRPDFRQIKFLYRNPTHWLRVAPLPVPLWHLFWWCADPHPQSHAKSAQTFRNPSTKFFFLRFMCAVSSVIFHCLKQLACESSSLVLWQLLHCSRSAPEIKINFLSQASLSGWAAIKLQSNHFFTKLRC